MAKNAPPEPAVARPLSGSEIDRGIARLRKRLEQVVAFNPHEFQDRNDGRIDALETSIDQALADTFGPGSVDYMRYAGAKTIDRAPMIMGRRITLDELQQGLSRGKDRAAALLTSALEALEERRGDVSEASSVAQRPRDFGRRIFLVHGHDEAAKEAVARFLELLQFEVIILHEKANKGKTVIEKFETHADVAFAVVLLTPDDVMPDGSARARQNVVLELGYFIGRLTRERVCAFRKGNVDLPSDILGVVYTPMDDAGAWRQALAKELDAAGLAVDWNTVMRGS